MEVQSESYWVDLYQVLLFVFLDFVNAARQVFSIQLDDHSLSDSAVQFAIQDVNNTASVAAKNNTFEEVGDTAITDEALPLVTLFLAAF